ncbi:MAG: TIGR02186 family protein [Deltaproteobacteria bacterium]|nr:TIGR02186 family protein [Deltaproteobacteria bacterium]MBW2007104.1 TIGR02186 family protein [Deltaproteobacteria bacterium]
MIRKLLILFLFVCVVFFPVAVFASARESSVEISPSSLEMGTFFSGKAVKISGRISSGRHVIIEIRGPEEKSIFNVKGRMGPFWMNRGKVELEHAPFFYMLLLPPGDDWTGRLPALGIGLENLEKEVDIHSGTLDADTVFRRFVRLKRFEGLYGEMKDAIHYSHKEPGGKEFVAEFRFPSSTAPGEYRIVFHFVRNARVESRLDKKFDVEEVGFIRTVREVAYSRSLLYGFLCVVIALFVGTVMGLLFKGSGAH